MSFSTENFRYIDTFAKITDEYLREKTDKCYDTLLDSTGSLMCKIINDSESNSTLVSGISDTILRPLDISSYCCTVVKSFDIITGITLSVPYTWLKSVILEIKNSDETITCATCFDPKQNLFFDKPIYYMNKQCCFMLTLDFDITKVKIEDLHAFLSKNMLFVRTSGILVPYTDISELNMKCLNNK